MMETELTEQREKIPDISESQFRKDVILSKYAKIQTNEELFIDPNDIQLGSSSENMITGTISPVNSDELSGPISIETSKNYLFKKIGKCYAFLGNKRGDPTFIIGPNWFKFILSLFTITIIFLYFFRVKWNSLGGLMKFMGVIIYLLYFLSHLYTELINPGYPKHNLDSKTGEPRSRYNFCNICKMWVSKEKNTKHCQKCDICIEGCSRHYLWMSKCIGRNNQMFFYIYIISFVFTIGFIGCILATKNKQIPNNSFQ
jgi:ferredoxin